MALYTGADFISYIRNDLGGVDSTLITDARILRWANQAYTLDVAAVLPFPELESSATITTESGTAEYTFATSAILRILSVTDKTNYFDLTSYEIDREYYEHLTQGNPGSGNPVHWFISGISTTYRQITFEPTPDGRYSIVVAYKLQPTYLTSGTSTILTTEWDDVIECFAVARGFLTLGDMEKARMWKGWAMEARDNAWKAGYRSKGEGYELGTSLGESLNV